MATRRSLLGLLPLLAPSLGRRVKAVEVAPTAASQQFDLDALMAGLAAVPERRATFQETRHFAALDQPLISTGRLLYRRPGYLEKTTDWPQPESLIVDGAKLVVTVGNEPPRVLDLGSQPELRTFVDAIRGPLAGDIAALRRVFTVSAVGSAGGWTLDLVPREPAGSAAPQPRAARLLRRAQVTGHGSDVGTVLLIQASGDEQQMTIRPLS